MPYIYNPLLYDKRGKNIQWRKDSLFSKCYRENWRPICKRKRLENCLIPYTEINSKWAKDLNVRPENIKLSEEDTKDHSLT